jgi:N4-gp56 family major capsid protein
VDGKYISIIHHDTERDMFGDSDILTSFQNAGPRDGSNPIITGAIGDLYQTRFIVTSNARIISSAGLSGADIYLSMFLGSEFYGITEFDSLAAKTFIKSPGSSGAQDPLDQYGTVGWKASLAVARLNENFAVRVEHTTSRSNAA